MNTLFKFSKHIVVRNMLFMLVLVIWSANVAARDFNYQARVEGMVCAFCAYNVNKKISALPGVVAETVDVDLKKGKVIFRSARAVSEDTLETVFSESGFTLFDLRETATPLAAGQQTTLLALDLKIDGLSATEAESLLEAVGNLAASQPSRIVIHAPAASEPDLLKPMLMGRQQVMKVRYIPTDAKPVRLQLYLLSR